MRKVQRRSSRSRWRRLARYIYLRLLRGTPAELSRGLGAGMFAGMLPLFGLQTLTALALAFLVRGNKIIAVLATWVSNPLTDIPIHLFNFRVGQWLLGTENLSFTEIRSWSQLFDQGRIVLLTWLSGGVTVGLITGLGSYGLGLWLIPHLQRRSSRQRST